MGGDLVLQNPRYRAPGGAMTGRLGRSWDVPEEFWILWRRSHELRTLIMQADVEPESKGPLGSGLSSPEFQRKVMDQMEGNGRYR